MMRRWLVVCPIVSMVLPFGCGADIDREATRCTALPVIGGIPDNDGQAHPAVVYLTVGGWVCSGSLVAPRLVLTARHCVSTTVVSTIRCNSNGESVDGPQVGADFDAANMSVYTGFDPGTLVAMGAQFFHTSANILCNNDIAFVLLDRDVTGVQPAKMRLNYGAQIGEATMVVGYGRRDPNDENLTGLRYRRGDIPVLTSGIDLNYLSGMNEFALGESTCQGDSGGPALAMSTGAVLGVTSRSNSCSGGTHVYTSVDKFPDLINQAFQAAAASPIAEGGTPPATTVKSTGDRPCNTGAECRGYLCVDAPNGYCSATCSAGWCPTGMTCRYVNAQMGEQKSDIAACAPIPKGTPCEDCRYANCNGQVEACLVDPAQPNTPISDCSNILKCMDACTTDACRSGCLAKYPTGASAYAWLKDCVCPGTCQTTCTGQCGQPPPGQDAGVGGAGGSGGDGGSGGTGAEGGAGGLGGASGAGGGSGTGGSAPSAGPAPDSGSTGGCALPRGSYGSHPWMMAALMALLAVRGRRRR